MGLDSNRTNPAIQKLIPYDPIAVVLFDSAIFKSLIPILLQMNNDSISKIGRVTEAAQGRSVFTTCIEFYKSSGLDILAKKEIKKSRRTKNINEYISSKYPTW